MAEYVKLEDLSKLTQAQPRTGHYSEVVTDTEYEYPPEGWDKED